MLFVCIKCSLDGVSLKKKHFDANNSNLKAIKNTITLEDIHFVEADTLEVHFLTLDPGSTMGMLNIQ